MKPEADDIDKAYTSACNNITFLADCHRTIEKRIELLEGIKGVLEYEIEELRKSALHRNV